jgi:hypothetical protein
MEHALMTYRRAWAGQLAEFDGWADAEIDPEGITIYDIEVRNRFLQYHAASG